MHKLLCFVLSNLQSCNRTVTRANNFRYFPPNPPSQNWLQSLEETFFLMCQSSRAIIFPFNGKTQWQMFLLLYGRHVCVPQKDTNMASAYKDDTLLQITREWKSAETWFLARLFIYQSPIVFQILDFFHRMVTIFSFDHMTGENWEYNEKYWSVLSHLLTVQLFQVILNFWSVDQL